MPRWISTTLGFIARLCADAIISALGIPALIGTLALGTFVAWIAAYQIPNITVSIVVFLVAFSLSMLAVNQVIRSLGSARHGSIPEGRSLHDRAQRNRDPYLYDEDTELGMAIRDMVHFSAWAKWFAAQHLTLNNLTPASEDTVLRASTDLVLDAAMNGKLTTRGRPADSTEYENISRETWRLVAIKMEPNPASLWRAVIFPRHRVEPARVRRILEYDSIIVNSLEFETLWPRHDETADKARMKLLKKARSLGADSHAIEKLMR